MDKITTLIVVGVIVFLLFSFCGWCCRNKKMETTFPTVAIPNVNTMPPNPNPPYPTQGGMMPQPVMAPMNPGPIGFAPYPPNNQPVYPPGPGFAPYPHVNQPMYSPYPPGFNASQPYPPYPGYPPTAASSSVTNPPSYDEAVSGHAYNKQSPYNPNFK